MPNSSNNKITKNEDVNDSKKEFNFLAKTFDGKINHGVVCTTIIKGNRDGSHVVESRKFGGSTMDIKGKNVSIDNNRTISHDTKSVVHPTEQGNFASGQVICRENIINGAPAIPNNYSYSFNEPDKVNLVPKASENEKSTICLSPEVSFTIQGTKGNHIVIVYNYSEEPQTIVYSLGVIEHIHEGVPASPQAKECKLVSSYDASGKPKGYFCYFGDKCFHTAGTPPTEESPLMGEDIPFHE